MKTTFRFLTILLAGTLLLACEKDNFDAPSANLTGRLLYEGEPIYLEYNRVSYQLYQDGFGKTGPIGSTFTPEGEFSHQLFNGEYKMVIPPGQGPFVALRNASDQPDTIMIDLRGNQNLDIEVTPYWRIRDAQLNAGEGRVSSTFGLEQIATGNSAREVESATLYVSKTAFANTQTNIATAGIAGGDITDMNNISLSVGIPEIRPTQNYVFASIGVKFVGVDDLIFSATERLDF
ncbi:DUF3823 domain-containing protein [Lewinella sp. IMCC34183]|uniref:DUF3823 domain-containing protein n=1 Tax=Lewinella sp. IMCC34183 TaxID=2248762 RepID=UPI000E247B9D|nr:DUF3823 domain-containing protein [Lewinella sp. IMCC34183]